MRRRSRQQTDAPGQDSFLDIVANLVGILIILVMVVGARAKDAMVEAAPVEAAEEIDVETPRSSAVALEGNINELESRIERQYLEVAFRRKERDKLLALIKSGELSINADKDKLDETERERFESQRSLTMARNELDDLKRSRQAVDRSAPQTNVIRHLPTPMAKTVFGKEIHFRLMGGRVTYVPWDELVERLKAEAPQKLWKLKNAPRITEIIGPVEGFRMQYTLAKNEIPVETGAGPMVQRHIELDRFVLVPVADELGEPVQLALQEGSDFRAALAGLDPNRTTITVWVYPDSFNEFRLLKETLFGIGFLTASRPLPENELIGGSPNGSRSSAQ